MCVDIQFQVPFPHPLLPPAGSFLFLDHFPSTSMPPLSLVSMYKKKLILFVSLSLSYFTLFF